MSTDQQAATAVVEKRNAILAEATRVFAHEGYRNADVQVIADAAGVGKGTVYRYFGSKEELFWAVTMNVTQQLEQRLLAISEQPLDCIEMLRRMAAAYAKLFEDNPDYLEILVQERAQFRGSAPQSHVEYHSRLIDRFAEVVQRGIDADQVRPVDPRKTIVSLGGVLYGSVAHACFDSIGMSLGEAAEHAVELLLAGIRTTTEESPSGTEQ